MLLLVVCVCFSVVPISVIKPYVFPFVVFSFIPVFVSCMPAISIIVLVIHCSTSVTAIPCLWPLTFIVASVINRFNLNLIMFLLLLLFVFLCVGRAVRWSP